MQLAHSRQRAGAVCGPCVGTWPGLLARLAADALVGPMVDVFAAGLPPCLKRLTIQTRREHGGPARIV